MAGSAKRATVASIGGFAAALAAALLMLIAPAPSSARDKQVRVSLQAHVALDDGMEAYLYAHGEPGPDRTHLTISRNAKASELRADYKSTEEGKSTAGRRIVTRLGDRGSMRLAFEPRGPVRVRRYDGCTKVIDQKGVLNGYLRFRGERHYVDIVEHKLKAHRYKVIECRRRPPPRPPEFHELVSCTEQGTRLRAYNGFREGESFMYSVGPMIKKRGLAVSDLAAVSGTDSEFKVSKDGNRATVAPGAPFSGTAKFTNDMLKGDLVMPTIRGPEFPLTPGQGHLDGSSGCGGIRGGTALAPQFGLAPGTLAPNLP